MPTTFERYCDIYQGYNFKKDVQTTVGFLQELKIGDVALRPDQTCKDPMSPAVDLAVVAVLSGVLWELGVSDALYFSGQISAFNQQQVKLLAYKDLAKIDVTCVFTVYEYDPLEKKYFKCLLPTDDRTLDGLLEKRGDDLDIDVADDPSTEVQSPENYAFQIGIEPQPVAQAITLGTSFSVKMVKAWGLKVDR